MKNKTSIRRQARVPSACLRDNAHAPGAAPQNLESECSGLLENLVGNTDLPSPTAAVNHLVEDHDGPALAALCVVVVFGQECTVQHWTDACGMLGFDQADTFLERAKSAGLLIQGRDALTFATRAAARMVEICGEADGSMERARSACAEALAIQVAMGGRCQSGQLYRILLDAGNAEAAMLPLFIDAWSLRRGAGSVRRGPALGRAS